MSDIPFIILAFITGVIAMILSLGYLYRTSFPMSTFWFISGAIFLLIFITTDAIIIGYTEPINNESQLLSTVHVTTSGTEDIQLITLSASNTGGADTEESFARSGTNTVHTELITVSGDLVGEDISTITLRLKKSGSPTGIATVCVFDSSANCLHQFGTKDVSTLTTSYVNYNFSSSPYTISSDNRIGIKYSGGSSGNDVRIRISSDLYDSTNSMYSRGISSFTNLNTFDLWFRAYSNVTLSGNPALDNTYYNYNGDNRFIDSEPITYAIKELDEDGAYTLEPTFIGMMLIILSLSFIMVGALIEKFN